MRLIADSGATKTLWYSLISSSITSYSTVGYHPYYWTTEELLKSLKKELLPQLPKENVEEVFFYGAGCAQEEPKAKIQQSLEMLFPKAIVHINSDLLAVARATANNQAGICCILGTGAASLQYDGTQIIDQVPSLGYLLGDEGSGADLGRQLLQAYYYRQFPPALKKAFEQDFLTDKYHVIQSIQQAQQPSKKLAQYTQFAVKHSNHVFIQALIKQRFKVFLDHQIRPYQKVEQENIHFVGSVAYGFRTLLEQVIAENNWKLGRVLKNPFPALLEYHL